MGYGVAGSSRLSITTRWVGVGDGASLVIVALTGIPRLVSFFHFHRCVDQNCKKEEVVMLGWLRLSLLPVLASAVPGQSPRGLHPIADRYTLVGISSIDDLVVDDAKSNGAIIDHLSSLTGTMTAILTRGSVL